MNKWFKNPFAYLALLIPALIGGFFVLGGVPGFSKLPTSTDQLRITIVDQDKTAVTKSIRNGLKDNVPFKHVTISSNLSAAKSRLSDRTDAMTVQLPAGFTKDVEAGKNPKLNFYVSDSNGLLQNNVTRSVISAVQGKIATELTTARTTGAMAKQMAPQIAKQVAAKAQANAAKQQASAAKQGAQMNPAAAKQMQQKMQQQVKQTVAKQTQLQAQKAAQKLSATPDTHTTHLHKIGGNYQYQMGPMFLNMGFYLGLMIMSIILTLMFMGARYAMGKWPAFLMAQINGVLATVIGPLVTVSLLRCFIQFNGGTFMSLLGSEWLFGLGAFELSFSLALLLGGLPSFLIQLPLMVSQTIAGGAIIPRQAMNSFYQWLSYHTPMYQGVYMTFNSLYGGGNGSAYSTTLWLIVAVGLIITILAVAIGYRGKEPRGFSRWISFN
ncbi:MAG TPA: hypothetical protein DDW71_12890 [Lactobacillus sp.]|nr:hypothetical protein [Lactobacillus sp.]